MSRKIISLVLSLCFIFQQTGLAQAAAVEFNLSGYFARMASSMDVDKFRPIHLRYFSYDSLNNSFKLLLDKGDFQKDQKDQKGTSSKGTPSDISREHGASSLQEETQKLLNYFLIGITLPNDKFWVNLRPDSPRQIIDFNLEETDIGKIMLEADLQLKKDTAQFTSPQTPEGKEYWNRLYKKAGEIYGSENITIPTLTRPWIVPNEIIVRETKDSAYIYKATLKVMLEQDYLKDSSAYNFKDSRAKALNEYSSQLIRELIIPKLTKEINLSKRYAPLRQVYYSLILSRWFKSRFAEAGDRHAYPLQKGTVPDFASLIDKNDLTNLASIDTWSKSTYFNAYKKSFADGEYNTKEPVYTPSGQTIRSYFSGGINVGSPLTQAITNRINIPDGTDMFNALRRMNMAPFQGNGLSLDLQSAGSPIQNTTNTLRDNLINGLGEQDYPSNSTLPEVLKYWVESITFPFKEQNPPFTEEETMIILKTFIFAADSMKKTELSQDPNPYLEKADEFITTYLNNLKFNGWLSIQKKVLIKNASLVPFKYIRADMTLLPKEWTVQKMVLASDAISRVIRTALDIAAGSPTASSALEKDLADQILGHISARADSDHSTSYLLERDFSGISRKDREEISMILKRPTRGDLPYDTGVRDSLKQYLKKSSSSIVASTNERQPAAGEEVSSSAVQIEVAIGQYKGNLNLWFNRLKNSGLTETDISAAKNILGEFQIVKDTLRTDAKKTINFLMNFLERDIILRLSQADRDNLAEQKEQKHKADLLEMFPMLPESIIMLPESRRLIEASRSLLEQIKLSPFAETANASSAVYNKFLSRETEKDIADYIDRQPTRYMREQARSEIEERLGDEYTPRDISATLNDFFEVKQGTGRDKSYTFSGGIVISQKRSSSPMDKTGGIDFKHQAMASATTYETMGSFVGLDFSLPKLNSQALLSFNLDKEQSDISRAIDNGIIVSGQRIKEFMSASVVKGELQQRRDVVITWLAKLGILEETTCCTQESSKEYREALVIADSA